LDESFEQDSHEEEDILHTDGILLILNILGEESSEHSSINIEEYLKKREEIASSSDEEAEN
jgi:hypothetical protein